MHRRKRAGAVCSKQFESSGVKKIEQEVTCDGQRKRSCRLLRYTSSLVRQASTMPQCSYSECRNEKGKNGDKPPEQRVSFFQFPYDDVGRFKQWVANINRMDPRTKKLWKPTNKQAHLLCSDHFDESMFTPMSIWSRQIGLSTGLKLKEGAIPTIFSHKRPAETEPPRPRSTWVEKRARPGTREGEQRVPIRK